MPIVYLRIGDIVHYDGLEPGLRDGLLSASPGQLFAAFIRERGTIEMYRCIVPGRLGNAEFVGYLSPQPVLMKEVS